MESPGGRFTGVEGDQRRGRSSGVGERVGGIGSGWRWRRESVHVTGGPEGEAPLLARGPPKACLAASYNYSHRYVRISVVWRFQGFCNK